MYTWNDGTYLMHHGIKGQKWGVRRFQNDDGSLTAAGRERYGYGARGNYKNRMGMAKASYKQSKRTDSKTAKSVYRVEKQAARKEYKNSEEYKERRKKMIKAAAITGAAVVAGLAVYKTKKVLDGKVQDANKEIADGRNQLSYLFNHIDKFTDSYAPIGSKGPYGEALVRGKDGKRYRLGYEGYSTGDPSVKLYNLRKMVVGAGNGVNQVNADPLRSNLSSRGTTPVNMDDIKNYAEYFKFARNRKKYG